MIKFINVKLLLKLILFYILWLLLIFPLWVNSKFGNISLEQFNFHLSLVYFDIIGGDSRIIQSSIKWFFVIPTILSILFVYLQSALTGNFKKNSKKINYFFKLSSNLVIFLFNKFNTRFIKFFLKLYITILIFFVLIIILFFDNTLFFNKTIKIKNSSDFFEKSYVEPNISVDKNKLKNTIIIYLESFEKTFSNPKFSNKKLLSKINANNTYQSINNYKQIPGFGWTIGSLVATQCGIPLLDLGFFSGNNWYEAKKFLPNIKCLSDITYKNDFNNIFITSDDIESAGTNIFLANHNYNEIYDLNYFSNNGYKLSKNAYYNKNKFKGGIHDSTIFEFIIKKIENLDLSKKHLITAFTLDTHAVDGYPSISCLKKIKDKKDLNNYIYQNTVKCTAEALAKFIEIFHKKNLHKNFNLILIGDHLSMRNYNKEKIKESERSIFNQFYLIKKQKILKSEMIFFDLYPSLVEILGFHIEDSLNRVAFGYSIFDANPNPLPFNTNYKSFKKSKKYLSFWGIE